MQTTDERRFLFERTFFIYQTFTHFATQRRIRLTQNPCERPFAGRRVGCYACQREFGDAIARQEQTSSKLVRVCRHVLFIVLFFIVLFAIEFFIVLFFRAMGKRCASRRRWRMKR
jgi:hypothetical protein